MRRWGLIAAAATLALVPALAALGSPSRQVDPFAGYNSAWGNSTATTAIHSNTVAAMHARALALAAANQLYHLQGAGRTATTAQPAEAQSVQQSVLLTDQSAMTAVPAAGFAYSVSSRYGWDAYRGGGYRSGYGWNGRGYRSFDPYSRGGIYIQFGHGAGYSSVGLAPYPGLYRGGIYSSYSSSYSNPWYGDDYDAYGTYHRYGGNWFNDDYPVYIHRFGHYRNWRRYDRYYHHPQHHYHHGLHVGITIRIGH